jgi:purine-binding chemotaxis protein CheW
MGGAEIGRGRSTTSRLALLCRVHHLVCALPLEHVIETLRPLSIEPLAGAPGYVCGVSMIRGMPVPVVDTGLLLGSEQARPTRLVTLRAGSHTVAIAVDSVIGVRALGAAETASLPPLLRAAGNDAVVSLGSRHHELLLVLESARMVPEQLLDRLASEGSAA